MSHGRRTSLEKKKTKIEVLSSKRNLALKMATKKVENKSQERKGPVRPRKNWAKELPKEALIKLIREGKSPSNCKFRFTLISGLESKGQHKSRDTWAALLEVETKDISLVKRFNDSDVILLMIRENVCQKAIRNLKDNMGEIQVCDDVSLLTSFLLARKNIVLEELLRLSKTFKNFIPLVEACKYIKKELNKEKPDYGSFTYLGKKMGEPARESKDFNNE